MSKDILFNLAANTASFQANMQKAAQSVQSMRDAIKVIEAEAIVNLGKKAAWAARLVFEFAEAGAKVKAIEESFSLVARNTGVSIDGFIDKLKEATNATIDDSDLMRKAVKGILEGFSPEQMAEIGEAARIAARIGGTDVATAYDALTDAIVNVRERGLKTVGIIIDMDEALKKQAKTQGVAKDALNEYGKQMAMLNAVIEKKNELQAKLNLETGKSYEVMQTQKAALKEIYEWSAKVASSDWNRIIWFFGSIAEKITAAAKGMAWLHEQWMKFGGKLGVIDVTPPGYPTEREHAGYGPPTPKKSQIDFDKLAADEEKRIKALLEANKDLRESLGKQALVDERMAWAELNNELTGTMPTFDQILERSKALQEALQSSVPVYEAYQESWGAIGDELVETSTRLGITIAELQQIREGIRQGIKDHSDYVESLKPIATEWDKIGKEFGDALTSNMVQLMSATESWGEKFKKVGESILQTIMQIIMKQLIMNALFKDSEKGKGFGGGWLGSLISGIGGLFGGGGYSGYNWNSNPMGYQHGTDYVPKTGLAVVHQGEKIIPASQNNGGGGGGGVYIGTYIANVEATDVDSFEKKYGGTIQDINRKSLRSRGNLHSSIRRY